MHIFELRIQLADSRLIPWLVATLGVLEEPEERDVRAKHEVRLAVEQRETSLRVEGEGPHGELSPYLQTFGRLSYCLSLDAASIALASLSGAAERATATGSVETGAFAGVSGRVYETHR